MAPAEAAETAQIWDQGAEALRKRGVDGAFAFLDEHQESIDDGLLNFYGWADRFDYDPIFTSWGEMPSDRHNLGCNFSFADGHVEHWRWKWPKVFETYDQKPANDLDKADLRRLQNCLPIE